MGEKNKTRNKKIKTARDRKNAQEITAAVAHQQAGRLIQAEGIYRSLLAKKPDCADALHGMGLLAERHNNRELALEYISKAIKANPHQALFYYNKGSILQQVGRTEDAVICYQDALLLKHDYMAALENMTKGLMDMSRFKEALAGFDKIKSLEPESLLAKEGPFLLITTCDFSNFQPEVYEKLKDYYSSPGINYQAMEKATVSQIKHKTTDHTFPGDALSMFYDMASDELLHSFLSKARCEDPELELLLTKMRRILLLEKPDKNLFPEKKLLSAICMQSFQNEYLYFIKDDEKNRLTDLKISLDDIKLKKRDGISSENERNLLLYGMYAPLHMLSCADRLAEIPPGQLSEELREILKVCVSDFFQEEAIKTEIDSVGEISNSTSNIVRAQYEENPFPRWIHIPSLPRVTLSDKLKHLFPDFTPPDFLSNDVRVLIAGCGTGQHPIAFALTHSHSRVTALDLSRSSLAYAIRMARKMGINNITFAQGDILNLGSLDEQFHLIDCCGVLHHLERPSSGLKALLQLLVPGGLINLGLYSEKARAAVVKARELISKRRPEKETIRALRHRILTHKEGETLFKLSTMFRDFYSMSECRDLLFHEKEHRFSISGIKDLLFEHGLEFIGFEIKNSRSKELYMREFPEDRNMNDLLKWDIFENRYPDTFSGMYQFWCRKKL